MTADWPVIYAYTRAQAVEDGELHDVTEWGSADKGFHGGFACPVYVTRALWAVIDGPRPAWTDVRGRAHDVLWMASLAARGALARRQRKADFTVLMATSATSSRNRKLWLRLAMDDAVTIGFPEDF